MKRVKDIKSGVPVILADGLFPKREGVLDYLHQANIIIACDGATSKLLDFGLEPTHIVGDLDSLGDNLKTKYASIITSSTEQETNDLTKAVAKAQDLGIKEAVILGATGEREDHTLGNIGLLAEHASKMNLQLVTDYGRFYALTESATLQAYPGQQISILNPIGQAKITTHQLKYPIRDRVLNNWWEGTLNEALDDQFSLVFEGGVLVVFCTH